MFTISLDWISDCFDSYLQMTPIPKRSNRRRRRLTEKRIQIDPNIHLMRPSHRRISSGHLHTSEKQQLELIKVPRPRTVLMTLDALY